MSSIGQGNSVCVPVWPILILPAFFPSEYFFGPSKILYIVEIPIYPLYIYIHDDNVFKRKHAENIILYLSPIRGPSSVFKMQIKTHQFDFEIYLELKFHSRLVIIGWVSAYKLAAMEFSQHTPLLVRHDDAHFRLHILPTRHSPSYRFRILAKAIIPFGELNTNIDRVGHLLWWMLYCC